MFRTLDHIGAEQAMCSVFTCAYLLIGHCLQLSWVFAWVRKVLQLLGKEPAKTDSARQVRANGAPLPVFIAQRNEMKVNSDPLLFVSGQSSLKR